MSGPGGNGPKPDVRAGTTGPCDVFAHVAGSEKRRILIREQLRHLPLAFVVALLTGGGHAEGATAQGADFLFKRPTVTLGAWFGYALPGANSEIFDFTRDQLTIEKSDFNALSFGGEVSVRVADRVDAALSLGYEQSTARSEFRDFIDDRDLPIEQDTRFSRVPLTVGLKAYVLERGRRISRLAWIPSKWAPYVGAGVGIVWYQFEQTGDFVDFDTFDIFFDTFESRGSSPLAYLAGRIFEALQVPQ